LFRKFFKLRNNRILPHKRRANYVGTGISPGIKRRSIRGPEGTPMSHLEQKHDALNHLFGFIPTAVPVTHRPLEARSTVVQKLYEPPKKVQEDVEQGKFFFSIENLSFYRKFDHRFKCNLDRQLVNFFSHINF
jgi:hypothetical protein